MLLVVRDTRNAILAPAVGASSRLFMGEVVPRIAIGAVVFPHRAPLPLAEVRTPFFPRRFPIVSFRESCLFYRTHGCPYLPRTRRRISGMSFWMCP